MRYTVFVGGVFDNSFDTLEKAEDRVAEIINKYDFINPDIIHIIAR